MTKAVTDWNEWGWCEVCTAGKGEPCQSTSYRARTTMNSKTHYTLKKPHKGREKA